MSRQSCPSSTQVGGSSDEKYTDESAEGAGGVGCDLKISSEGTMLRNSLAKAAGVRAA